MKKLLSVLLSVILVSCSSSTVINTDQDVTIYTDGQRIGKGSAVHSDTKTLGSTTQVTLKKKGCKDQNYIFSRSEQLDVGAVIGGCFVLLPWLWIQKYNPSRSYEFECVPDKS